MQYLVRWCVQCFEWLNYLFVLPTFFLEMIMKIGGAGLGVGIDIQSLIILMRDIFEVVICLVISWLINIDL